jgi:hypothetical protein
MTKCKYWDAGWCYAPKDVSTNSQYGFDTFRDDIGMCLLDPQGREWNL